MLSLCISYAASVASLFRSSIFHFLAKLSKIGEIFFSCEKKTMKLSLLHKNVNTSSHRKGNLMALTAVYQFELWLKVRDMPSKLSLPRPGSLVWVKQVFELSEVELTEFHCTLSPISGFNYYRKWMLCPTIKSHIPVSIRSNTKYNYMHVLNSSYISSLTIAKYAWYSLCYLLMRCHTSNNQIPHSCLGLLSW